MTFPPYVDRGTSAPDPDVLFVGINYAPEHTGIGPYTTAAAEHLAAQGASVRVITGLPHYPQWTVDPLGRRTGLEITNGVEIERFRHYVPVRQDAARRALYELSFAAQVGRRIGCRPRTVIAVVPSLLSAVVASGIARRSGARLIVWVQDSMGAAAAQSGMAGGQWVAGLVGAVERYVYSQADHTLIASGAFRPHVQACGAAPDSVIDLRNWTHIGPAGQQREVVRRRLGWADDQVVVLHSGNMGLKQDLGRVIEAARLSASAAPRVRYVLMGEGSQRRELAAACTGTGNVEVLAPVAAEDYSDVLAAADQLLINERAGVLDMSLPSKLTSYFSVGRPVVASVHPDGGTAHEVRQSGGGAVTAAQTPEALVATVLRLIDDPGAAAELGRRGRRHAEERLQQRHSLDTLGALVAGPRIDHRLAQVTH